MKSPSPPWRPARPGELNYEVVDRWTLIHLAAGLGFSRLGVTPLGMVGLATAWEFLLEPVLKRTVPEVFYPATGDSLVNSLGDIAANVVGNYFGHRLLDGVRESVKTTSR